MFTHLKVELLLVDYRGREVRVEAREFASHDEVLIYISEVFDRFY